MTKLVWLASIFFVFQTVQAASSATGELEPIFGYERVQKLVPTPHTKDRLIYGLRYSIGVPLLSAEAEYTRGMDQESFPTSNMDTKDTADRLKVGIRSRVRMGSFLSAFARAGGEAYRNIHEETVSGTTTRTEQPIQYSPYAGAGLNARLGKQFTLNAGLTVVFRNFPVMTQNDYQATAGFTVKFP
jgi:hypothetical protein